MVKVSFPEPPHEVSVPTRIYIVSSRSLAFTFIIPPAALAVRLAVPEFGVSESATKEAIFVAVAVAPEETIKSSPVDKSVIVSVPKFTLKVSFPLPPVVMSLPAPPVILSFPFPAFTVSTAFPPVIISAPSYTSNREILSLPS